VFELKWNDIIDKKKIAVTFSGIFEKYYLIIT